jgi:hypothetical protein
MIRINIDGIKMEVIMASKKKPTKEITILGYVSEIENENDDFVGVKISTDDDDYYVTQNKISKILENLIDEDVEVTGIVSADGEDGIKYITVTDYEVLNLDYGYEDDEETEDDDFFNDDYFKD